MRVPLWSVERDWHSQMHIQYVLNYGWMRGLDIPSAGLSLSTGYGGRQDIISFFLFPGLLGVYSKPRLFSAREETAFPTWQADFSALWTKQLLEFHYHGSPASHYEDITAQYHSRTLWSFMQVLESLGLGYVHACVCVCMHTKGFMCVCLCMCIHCWREEARE